MNILIRALLENWLYDKYYDNDGIYSLTDKELLDEIERNYLGGVDKFIKDKLLT